MDDKRVPVWLDCDPGHDVSSSNLLVSSYPDYAVRDCDCPRILCGY